MLSLLPSDQVSDLVGWGHVSSSVSGRAYGGRVDKYAGNRHRTCVRFSRDEFVARVLRVWEASIGAGFSSLLLHQHASAREDLAAAAIAMTVTVLVQPCAVLLADDAPVHPPTGWTLIPRSLWAFSLALHFFLSSSKARLATGALSIFARRSTSPLLQRPLVLPLFRCR